MAADRKTVQARMRRLQTRHLDAAQYAVRQREKGREPNTVQYSARIIGVFSGRECAELCLELPPRYENHIKPIEPTKKVRTG